MDQQFNRLKWDEMRPCYQYSEWRMKESATITTKLSAAVQLPTWNIIGSQVPWQIFRKFGSRVAWALNVTSEFVSQKFSVYRNVIQVPIREKRFTNLDLTKPKVWLWCDAVRPICFKWEKSYLKIHIEHFWEFINEGYLIVG